MPRWPEKTEMTAQTGNGAIVQPSLNPTQVAQFRVINGVVAPYSASGRSTSINVQDTRYPCRAWLSSFGIHYQFGDGPERLAPWTNVIEVAFEMPFRSA